MNKCCFIIKCILEIVFSLIIIRNILYPVISQTAPFPRSRDGGQVGPRLLFRISAGLRSVEHQSRPLPSDDHRSSPTSISSLVHALEATMFSDFDLQPCPRPSLSTPFAVDALRCRCPRVPAMSSDFDATSSAMSLVKSSLVMPVPCHVRCR